MCDSVDTLVLLTTVDTKAVRLMTHLLAYRARHVLRFGDRGRGHVHAVVFSPDVPGEGRRVDELVRTVHAGLGTLVVRLAVPRELGSRVQHEAALAHVVAHRSALVQVVSIPRIILLRVGEIRFYDLTFCNCLTH